MALQGIGVGAAQTSDMDNKVRDGGTRGWCYAASVMIAQFLTLPRAGRISRLKDIARMRPRKPRPAPEPACGRKKTAGYGAAAQTAAECATIREAWRWQWAARRELGRVKRAGPRRCHRVLDLTRVSLIGVWATRFPQRCFPSSRDGARSVLGEMPNAAGKPYRARDRRRDTQRGLEERKKKEILDQVPDEDRAALDAISSIPNRPPAVSCRRTSWPCRRSGRWAR